VLSIADTIDALASQRPYEKWKQAADGKVSDTSSRQDPERLLAILVTKFGLLADRDVLRHAVKLGMQYADKSVQELAGEASIITSRIPVQR
jgi:hypothetical protein